jgi:hypothetical protein
MRDHFEAILEYAKAYAAMERLQRQEGALFPIGDQKTGVIAEFYARLYVSDQFPEAKAIYGTPSEHAWDITVRREHLEDHKIQVKSVSSHSQTSRISPIHPGWHELYLMRFDAQFHPVGFWVLSSTVATWSGSKLGASTMPCRHPAKTGSAAFVGAVDRLDALNRVIERARA